MHVLLWVHPDDVARVADEIMAYGPAHYSTANQGFIPPDMKAEPLEYQLYKIVLSKYMHKCTPLQGKADNCCDEHGKCKMLFPFTVSRTLGTTFDRHIMRVSGRDKTPGELFFGKKPDVSDMHIFGTPAYALIPKELRRKLDVHSELGHFVGYPATTKGSRIYMPSGNVFIASDVTFVENKDLMGTTPNRGEEPVEPDILK